MSTPDAPNVLLICTDHLASQHTRPGSVGLPSPPTVMTPTIDQLARSGVWFNNTYSATPVCIPARRALMTGLTPQSHGCYENANLPLPDVVTLAQCFRNAGYQAFASGKLHVFPQRDRIGFDDVMLHEEGRHQFDDIPDGRADDWELFLADRGYGGQEFASGMNNNDYMTRPWPLPEDCHPTNWTAREMCRLIRRRDPRKPGFWYMSFAHPHPPLWPLQAYLDLYRDVELDQPVVGDWARRAEDLPYTALERKRHRAIDTAPQYEVDLARRAFYAMVTHIDHQIRVVVGYLREAGLLNNTIIAFTADHGDMLGDHQMWGKALMYDPSARVPLLIVPRLGDERIAAGTRDDRLAAVRDVMPTLLDLAGVPIPDHVEGMSLVGGESRDHLTAAYATNAFASRMVRDRRHKLIWYAAGNRFQLFNMQDDPRETRDLAADPTQRQTRDRLTQILISELKCGFHDHWFDGDELVGEAEPTVPAGTNKQLTGQRGLRFL
jgi:arylsulfatase A-like enzyme